MIDVSGDSVRQSQHALTLTLTVTLTLLLTLTLNPNPMTLRTSELSLVTDVSQYSDIYVVCKNRYLRRFLFNSPNFNSPNPIPNPNPNPIIGIRRIEIRRIERTPLRMRCSVWLSTPVQATGPMTDRNGNVHEVVPETLGSASWRSTSSSTADAAWDMASDREVCMQSATTRRRSSGPVSE